MKMNKWINYIVMPLFVGLIIAVVSFFSPKIFDDKKEISYFIYDSEGLLSEDNITNIDIKINEESTSDLYLNKVRIWNSGKVPIRDLQVLLKFETSSEDFKILGNNHYTIPEYEFGEIIDKVVDNISMRFKFSLLNPQDEDLLSIFSNQESMLKLYSKSENMKVKFRNIESAKITTITTSLIAGLIGIFALFIYFIIVKFINKKQGSTLEALSKYLINPNDDIKPNGFKSFP